MADIDKACMGLYLDMPNGDQNYSYTGFCNDGYYGAMCTSCEPRYYRSGSYGCEKCAGKTTNTLRIIGVMIIMMIIVIFLVKGTI